jgi:hypothetical protein
MGAMPGAWSRSVQRSPDPIVHFGDRSRTIWPRRGALRTRRTKSPADGVNPQGEVRVFSSVGTNMSFHQMGVWQIQETHLPLEHVAYGIPLVKTEDAVRIESWQIAEKGLYICDGFDDYPIATLVSASVLATSGVGGMFWSGRYPALKQRKFLRILTHRSSRCVVYFGC